MTTIKQDSHVYRLLTFLSYVGEYPLCSLQLFGSKEVWRKLIHKHSQRQEYRIPGHADKIICRLLLITGKGKSKSVRLSKGGQNILEIVNPNAALYYTQNYLRHNHAGEAKRLDRFHRVAESAALINLAGFETCPYRLPQLQMVTIRKVVTDAPSFYISKELKYVGDDDVNKTSFSRITGALFCPGGCYAVYNSRDYLMNWNGRGEATSHFLLTTNNGGTYMKTKIMKCLALVLAMTCILCFPTPASAAAQGTDGTELEVVQPEQLEIQLGESWAGVAFELKTDAGMYPGVILVGEDGILRLEIGGSTSYILTCMNSEVEIPEPDAAQRTEGVSEAEDTADTLPTEDTEAAAYPEESTAPVEADMADGTVSGIPIAHLALFGGGLIVAVGVLIGIHIFQKRREGSCAEDDDENDEI